jgi:hypothetical protein
MTQPEALRLAERLERYDATRSGYAKHCSLAAAELRRLHAVNQELLVALKMAEPLLQALQNNIVRCLPQYKKMPALDQVRAAIAKGEAK